MIDLYFANSGNSLRAVLALEECGLPYQAHKLDLQKKEQKSPSYLAINPFGVVPAMHDSDGIDGRPVTLTQSGAILLYAAEKTKQLVPADPVRRLAALQWFLMATTDAAPANAIIFYMDANVPDLSAAARAYLQERFVGLMRAVESHLAAPDRLYLAGEFSIADVALFPVVRIRRSVMQQVGGFTHIFAWADRLMQRDAFQRAIAA
jgi:GST-like protein